MEREQEKIDSDSSDSEQLQPREGESVTDFIIRVVNSTREPEENENIFSDDGYEYYSSDEEQVPRTRSITFIDGNHAFIIGKPSEEYKKELRDEGFIIDGEKRNKDLLENRERRPRRDSGRSSSSSD